MSRLASLRRPPANTPAQTPTTQKSTADAGWFKTGKAAVNEAETENKLREEQRNTPKQRPRMYVPVGQTRQVVILDEDFGPKVHEHNIRNPKTGKYDIFELCPKNWEPCPICESDGESQSVVFLTCLDLTPWTTKKGETVNYTKRLLPIKSTQLAKYRRLLEKKGTFRGMVLNLSRDGKKESNSGTPEFEEFLTEEEIKENFWNQAYVQDGKTLKTEGEDTRPYDYIKLFQKPSAARLRRLYGGSAPFGSDEDLEDTENTNPPWDEETPDETPIDLEEELPDFD